MPIYKNNGRYYTKITKNRKKWFPTDVGMTEKSWGTKREAKQAEAELRKRVDRMMETPTALDSLTVCNKYLDSQRGLFHGKETFNQKQRFCKEFIKEFGIVKLTDIAAYQVQSYLDGRAEKVSPNSYNVYRKEGRRLYNWAIQQEYLPDNAVNPFSRVPKRSYTPKKTGPAPEEDVLKVLKIANPDQRDILEVLLRTGARKSEILNMTVRDVDFDKRVYALRTRKTMGGIEKVRYYQMEETLFKIFKRKIDNKHPGLPYLFWHRYYSRKSEAFVCDKYQSLNRFTERLCEKAGVEAFGLHQLRHLATAILKEKGGKEIAQLQKFLGHECQRTTEIYANHLTLDTTETTSYLNDYLDEKLAV